MHTLYNKYILVLLMLMSGLVGIAQPKIVFDTPNNHVGEILYRTPKVVTFGFQNKGTEPFEILNVNTMCGCTKAEWTHGQILPGARGQITAEYDAKMLGTFFKELAVQTTIQDAPIYVNMEGRVVTKRLKYYGDFPFDLGNIRINTNYLEFDDVNRGDKPVAELQVFNQERTPYRPELMHLPSYLSMQAIPEVIAGGRTGRIRLILDSDKLGLLGLNQTRIFISRYLGDKVGEDNEIIVSSVLLPARQELSPEDLSRAPKMTLSKQELTFDPNDKKKLTETITITNNGQTKLNIRTVQVFNQALSVSLGNRTIEPDKSTTLKVTLNPKYLKKAKNRPRVLLITDDPEHAKQIINVNL